MYTRTETFFERKQSCKAVKLQREMLAETLEGFDAFLFFSSFLFFLFVK